MIIGPSGSQLDSGSADLGWGEVRLSVKAYNMPPDRNQNQSARHNAAYTYEASMQLKFLLEFGFERGRGQVKYGSRLQ